jgi:superfamily I DNA and/or RNA helicase
MAEGIFHTFFTDLQVKSQLPLEIRSPIFDHLILNLGTGKTTTIVEAIRLLLIAPTGFRILVCTPSNTAADLVAHELLKTEGIQNDVCLTNDKLFRMFSLTKSIDTQAQELRDISCIV